jgi:SPP1 family phage portal protein
VNRQVNIFGRVPVAFCSITRTIYDMIKSLNDSFNITLSNAVNENSDFRNAYIKVTGALVKEEDIQFFDSKGIINVPKDADVDFLIKKVDDAFLSTTLTELKDNIYECTGHINSNEKLASNTSSLALRARLITLEQRCQLMGDSISDIISTRLKFLFEYLKIKQNKIYDYKNIDIRFTPNVPQDLLLIASVISQLGGVEVSQETKLSLLPFIENPKLEMERIKLEHQNTMNKVDNFNNPYDKSNFDDNKDNIPDNGIPSDVPNINIGVLGDGDEDE